MAFRLMNCRCCSKVGRKGTRAPRAIGNSVRLHLQLAMKPSVLPEKSSATPLTIPSLGLIPVTSVKGSFGAEIVWNWPSW